MGIMNLTEIMDRSIEIVKKYIKTIILYNIGFLVIEFILAMLMFVLVIIIIAVKGITTSDYIFISVLSFLIAILILGMYFSMGVGIIKISGQEFLEERVYANSAVRVSVKSILKVIGITAVGVIAFIPVIFIFGVIAFYIYSVLNDPATLASSHYIERISLIIFSVIMLVAAIFTILAYLTAFVFSLQAMVFENKSIIGSIKRSFNLVKRNYFKMYGCIMLFGITIFAIRISINSFLAIISGLVFIFIKFLNININYTTFAAGIAVYLKWILTLISWLLISPISTIMLTLLYFNQRFKNEGYDILLKLKQLQKNNEGEHISEITASNNADKA